MDDLRDISINLIANVIYAAGVFLVLSFLGLIGVHFKQRGGGRNHPSDFRRYFAAELLRIVRELCMLIAASTVILMVARTWFRDLYLWKHILGWSIILTCVFAIGCAFLADAPPDYAKRSPGANWLRRGLRSFLAGMFVILTIGSLIHFIYFDSETVQIRRDLHETGLRLQELVSERGKSR
jgi:hypothetical protein